MEGMVTLKSACKEALRRGFKTIWIQEVCIHYDLAEFTDEIEEGGAEEYAVFGAFIIRVTDAWKEEAELFELD